jgi:hypothetical protein
MRIFRKLRAILATAITWGLVWVPFALVPFGIAAVIGGQAPSLRILGAIALGQGLVGIINGAVFASVVAVFGRRKTFESISLPWIATCGAVGGALFPFAVRGLLIAATDLPIPLTALAGALVTNAVLGAGCASLSLSFARRAPELSSGSRGRDSAITAGAA